MDFDDEVGKLKRVINGLGEGNERTDILIDSGNVFLDPFSHFQSFALFSPFFFTLFMGQPKKLVNLVWSSCYWCLSTVP